MLPNYEIGIVFRLFYSMTFLTSPWTTTTTAITISSFQTPNNLLPENAANFDSSSLSDYYSYSDSFENNAQTTFDLESYLASFDLVPSMTVTDLPVTVTDLPVTLPTDVAVLQKMILDKEEALNSLKKTLEMKMHDYNITKQKHLIFNCCTYCRHSMRFCEAKFMKEKFVDRPAHVDYRKFRDEYMRSVFEQSKGKHCTWPYHDECTNLYIEYKKNSQLPGSIPRSAKWILFIKWLLLSDEWEATTAEKSINGRLKAFHDVLEIEKKRLGMENLLEQFEKQAHFLWTYSTTYTFVKPAKIDININSTKVHETFLRLSKATRDPTDINLCSRILTEMMIKHPTNKNDENDLQ